MALKKWRPNQASLFKESRLTAPIRSDHHRHQLIGDFFETLLNDLLVGTLRGVSLDWRAQHLDLLHWGLKTSFEVKGVSNGQVPHIFVDQFEGLMRNIPFRFKNLCYLICSYRARFYEEGAVRSRLRQSTHTLDALDRYLCAETKEVYLVHHLLLTDLLARGQIAQVRGQNVIRVRLRDLRQLQEDQRRLRELRLCANRFRVSCRFRNRSTNFEVIVAAPSELATQFRALLAPRIRHAQFRKEIA